MQTITIEVYQFNELSDEAKEVARDWFRPNATDYEWYDTVYEDAKSIGLEIKSFDIDHNRHAKGRLTKTFDESTLAIMTQHGESCSTYQLAARYREQLSKLVEPHAEDFVTDRVFNEAYELYETAVEELEIEYERELLVEYSLMLQREWEHLHSDDHIDETIIANEYTFDVNGKRVRV